jgi:aminoglycoside 6'-N-acetyltransferase
LLARLRQRDIAGELNWFDDAPEERVGAAEVGADRLIVIVEDGTPIGDVTWFGVPYGPNLRSVAWKIGITLLPEYRGRGYGALAQSLLVDHLFAHSVSNRVEADTDVANIAEQRALERAGFVREGILREAQYRQGQWHDLAIFAKLRADRSANDPL